MLHFLRLTFIRQSNTFGKCDQSAITKTVSGNHPAQARMEREDGLDHLVPVISANVLAKETNESQLPAKLNSIYLHL